MTTPTTPAPAEPVWHRYQRQGVIEARAWTYDDRNAWRRNQAKVSVSRADEGLAAHSEPPTGFVARNPDNHADQWYIAPDYFAKHYAPVASTTATDVKRWTYGVQPAMGRRLYTIIDGCYINAELGSKWIFASAFDALAAENERLREERDTAVKHMEEGWITVAEGPVSRHYREKLEEAEAERDAAEVGRLRADAQRYRWLRQLAALHGGVQAILIEPIEAELTPLMGLSHDALDFAIDSAMALAPSPTNSDGASK